MDQLRLQSQELMANQSDDGSWGFQPSSEKIQTLGRAGQSVLGTEAVNAYKLLKYARIANDQVSLSAGLNALAFMEQFKIPRGAQSWECPIHHPDILAAAYAVGAGAYLLKSGFDKQAEARIHMEALEELGQSLENEVAPQVINLDDRTITLSGSVDEQYEQWREILADLYAAEVGQL